MLSEVQVWLISVLAMIIVWIIKFWRENYGKGIPSGWLTAGVYVISLGLAVLFQVPAIPAFAAFHDPVTFVAACLQWVTDFLVVIGPFVALATLLYNALLKRVLDSLGERMAAKG